MSGGTCRNCVRVGKRAMNGKTASDLFQFRKFYDGVDPEDCKSSKARHNAQNEQSSDHARKLKPCQPRKDS